MVFYFFALFWCCVYTCVSVGALLLSSSLFLLSQLGAQGYRKWPKMLWVLRVQWWRESVMQSFSGAYENCASASNPYFWNGPQKTLTLKAWLGMDSPDAPLPFAELCCLTQVYTLNKMAHTIASLSLYTSHTEKKPMTVRCVIGLSHAIFSGPLTRLTLCSVPFSKKRKRNTKQFTGSRADETQNVSAMFVSFH